MPKPDRQPASPKRHDHGLWATLAKTHAAGSVLPRHQHRSGQLVFAVRGVMLVQTQAARWTIPPQRALWLPPQHPHAIHMLSATEMRTVYCQPALIARCESFVRQDEVHAVVASPLIRELVLGLFNEQFDAPTRQLMVGLLLQTLQQTPSLPTQLPMPASEALRRALALLSRVAGLHAECLPAGRRIRCPAASSATVVAEAAKAWTRGRGMGILFRRSEEGSWRHGRRS